MIGLTGCLFSQLTPNQYLYDDNGMQGFGVIMSDRYPQLRYIYKHEKFLTQVAVQQPVTNDLFIPNQNHEDSYSYEPNTILPAIAGWFIGNTTLIGAHFQYNF